MAPLPANSTERWYLDYTVNGDLHHLLMRTPPGASESGVSLVYQGLFDLLDSANIYQVDVIGMRFSSQGSDVTLPAAYTGTLQFGAGTAVGNDFRAKTFSFTGRDASGHKTKFFVFGAITQAEGDYRLQQGANSAIDAVVLYLNSLTGYFVTIAGLKPIWNHYANIGFHDHWIKRARG
jgi:hypothetical protein